MSGRTKPYGVRGKLHLHAHARAQRLVLDRQLLRLTPRPRAHVRQLRLLLQRLQLRLALLQLLDGALRLRQLLHLALVQLEQLRVMGREMHHLLHVAPFAVSVEQRVDHLLLLLDHRLQVVGRRLGARLG